RLDMLPRHSMQHLTLYRRQNNPHVLCITSFLCVRHIDSSSVEGNGAVGTPSISRQTGPNVIAADDNKALSRTCHEARIKTQMCKSLLDLNVYVSGPCRRGDHHELADLLGRQQPDELAAAKHRQRAAVAGL